MTDWFHPRGSLRSGDWQVVVGPDAPGWTHGGLRVADVAGTVSLAGDGLERVLVPLAGGFDVDVLGPGGGRFRLDGRESVFDGPTDVLYAGAGTAVEARGTGRIAVAEAAADRLLPSARIPREAVPIELRGAGRSTRQVHDLGVPGVLDADRLIVCEVITPSGNWSSWPAHKHDEAGEAETALTEIYYFECAPERGRSPVGADPLALFATYPSPAGEIRTTEIVRSGDVALVPFGYHGPAAAAPGYDLYYLNVMAGPERAWRISDDPAHAWIRDTWAGEQPDPRLPHREERP